MQQEIISRLLCLCTVTSHGCCGLEHQPSPRGWAQSSPVAVGWNISPAHAAGPIQAQPSSFQKKNLCFICFENCDFPTDFSTPF